MGRQLKIGNCKLKVLTLIITCMLIVSNKLLAQSPERPLIWVKPADKTEILQKIKDYPQVKQYYKKFQKRVEKDIAQYQKDKERYVFQLPWNLDLNKAKNYPPFKTYISFNGKDRQEQDIMMHYLQTAVDCGVLYFLTEEESYAEYAATILHTFVNGLLQLPIKKEYHNAGWVYTRDHLREAREIGAQLPIIYDFVHSYLKPGGKVYDLAASEMVLFDFSSGQKVFRTYVDLALERGIINCNWPILESPSLVGNILALDNEQEREELLPYFLTKNTRRQDAFEKISTHYLDYGGDWPESINYSNGVNRFLTYLMTIMVKYRPSLQLGKNNSHILEALPKDYFLTYPNKTETLSFGDGHRQYRPNHHAYETAYHLAKLEKLEILQDKFGSLINSAVANEKYKRFQLKERSYSATYYGEPTKLLWFEPSIEGSVKDYPLPTIDELPFAGIVLQRNLSETNNPKDGLMSFVGGGHYVHGHATGMFMELYGKGFVLGNKAGRSTYRTEIHENYYRIFASNNTVVVNGASEGKGGWAGLEINTVAKIAVEPRPEKKPVSPFHSFSMTSFKDDKGDNAEAIQERTMGIVRTSPTTGYYIDVFRSKSELPNEFHDYIYHNIGESLQLKHSKGELTLTSDPNRYSNSKNKPWTNNKEARHPGWHYFKEIKSSDTFKENVTAVFKAEKLAKTSIGMKAFIMGNENRTYTKTMAPPTLEGPKVYRDAKTPTLVVRQNGEAWHNPFAVIYEPISNNQSHLTSVIKIERDGIFKGFQVTSESSRGPLKQYIIIQESPLDMYTDSEQKLSFTGRYAVITLDERNNLFSTYIGDGSALNYGNLSVKVEKEETAAVFISFEDGEPKVSTTKKIILKSGANHMKPYTPTHHN